jgi:hypothetical protein
VQQKNNGVYGAAMIQHRWNGKLPESAARVEYQLHRDFFQQFGGLKTATDVMARLPDVVERLIQTDERPFFKLTDAIPDRKGRHQGRVGTLPEWEAIIGLIRQLVGKPQTQLLRLNRDLIDAKRACANAIGYLTSAAAQLGVTIEGTQDLVSFLRDLLERNDIADETVKMKFDDKARRYGTWNEATEFPFGVNQAV